MGIGFDHCVDDDQQLSHAGDDHDLEQFAFVFEAFGELSDDGIASQNRDLAILPQRGTTTSSLPI